MTTQAENKELGPLERWRRDQRRKQGERLYNGTKTNLRKFFRPKQWKHGHLSELEGKLFLVEETEKTTYYPWGQCDGQFPLYWFSKRNNYLGVQDRKIAIVGITVMATGNVCKRSKQSSETHEYEQDARFVEVLTTDGVGYLNMRCLRLVNV